MIIQHACQNWEVFIPKNVETLVLGSFNPLNPQDNLNANYYYGRNTNYLWKAIGDLLYNNQFYYFNNGQLNLEFAFQAMNEYSFCFLDLINNIQITGQNELHENNFCNSRIYTNYSDNVLFTGNANFEALNINLQRNYNQNIIEFIQMHKPSKLIHTLGNNRINLNFNAYPVDFQFFLNQISNISQLSDTEITTHSISPSQININRNNLYEELKKWLKIHLNL